MSRDNKGAASIYFKYRYDTKNLVETLRRLEDFVTNTIKRNKKICDGVKVEVDGEVVALSDDKVKAYIKKEIEDMQSAFKNNEPFAERLTDQEKQYQQDIYTAHQTQYWNSQPKGKGVYEIPASYREYVSDAPIKG